MTASRTPEELAHRAADLVRVALSELRDFGAGTDPDIFHEASVVLYEDHLRPTRHGDDETWIRHAALQLLMAFTISETGDDQTDGQP